MTIYCQYRGCGKEIPESSRFGNKTAPHRRKKQKYCDGACARHEATAQRNDKIEAARQAQEICDRWIVRSA